MLHFRVAILLSLCAGCQSNLSPNWSELIDLSSGHPSNHQCFGSNDYHRIYKHFCSGKYLYDCKYHNHRIYKHFCSGKYLYDCKYHNHSFGFFFIRHSGSEKIVW